MMSVKFYARLEDCTEKKTPKYVIKTQVGEYPPMDKIKNKKGEVSMFLLSSKDSGSEKESAPAMRLQAKGNLNFTGLKNYYVDGKPSGYAYGYPLEAETYSSKKITNPFFKFSEDGFLFIIHNDSQYGRPSCIELMVLDGGKSMISEHCKTLCMGGFDDTLRALREQAVPPFVEEANDGFVEFREQAK